MFPTPALLLFLFTAHIWAGVVVQNQEDGILQRNFSIKKTTSRGYSELVFGLGGVIGWQRTVVKGNSSLRLLEVTNSSYIAQLIFSPSTQMVDCDVSNSAHQVRRLSKHVHSKYTKAAKHNILHHGNGLNPISNITFWIEKCYTFHGMNLNEFQSTLRSNKASSLTQSSDAAAEDITGNETRKKRGIVDLVYPGKIL